MSILGSLTNSLGITGTSQQTSADNTALHQKVHEAYVKMQAQKAMQAQQAYTTTTTQPGGFYPTAAINPYLAQNQTPLEIPTINLEEGAWDVPISQLVDLWTVRYGSKWVDESELDEFYKVASQRLRTLNKVESHFVNGKDVFRIVE